MSEILVTVTRHQALPDDIVTKVASEFLEFLERMGTRFEFPSEWHEKDWSYEEMAAAYVANIREFREGRLQ